MLRVLRLIEYRYPDAETMDADISRWTHASITEIHQFRSTTLPLEVLPDRTEPVVYVRGVEEGSHVDHVTIVTQAGEYRYLKPGEPVRIVREEA